MEKSHSRLIRTVFSFAVLAIGLNFSDCCAEPVKTLTFQDFEDGVLVPKGWAVGAYDGATVNVSTAPSLNFNGSRGSLRATYPKALGGIYAVVNYALPPSTNDIYIDFWAKMPGAKQGLKFLKIFGIRDSVGYANTTFNLDYSGADGDYGDMYQVSFGDGSVTENDTAAVINFSGNSPELIGRSFKFAKVETPQKVRWMSTNWGVDWHHFKIHVKFNSGTTPQNEVADGEYYVEIDNKVYVKASGLFNRHYSNQSIDRVAFFNWAQNGTAPFEVWLDNIRITTGGFLTAPAPKAPELTQVN
jgi:hypothetical protein